MEVMNPRPVKLASRLVVISAMVVAIVAQGFYIWAASLTFWLGPGQSPTVDDGLLIAHTTSVLLIIIAILVVVVARATGLGVTMCVWALLLLINFGLWIVVGVPGMITVVVLGSVWLLHPRRQPQLEHIGAGAGGL